MIDFSQSKRFTSHSAWMSRNGRCSDNLSEGMLWSYYFFTLADKKIALCTSKVTRNCSKHGLLMVIYSQGANNCALAYLVLECKFVGYSTPGKPNTCCSV